MTNRILIFLAACAIGTAVASGTGSLTAPRLSMKSNDTVCKASATALRRAGRMEAHTDFLVEIARAMNGDPLEFEDAAEEAWAERAENLELTEEQYAMRLAVCNQLGHGRYQPDIEPAEFSSTIDNLFLPYVVGRTLVYEKQTAEGLERVETTTLNETVEIEDVTCRSVRDVEFLDGEVTEDTTDWFAQHQDGTVWYFGEIARNYDDEGFLEDIDGSWRYGQDEAQPGIVMMGAPVVGTAYRQEYFIGEAEDLGRVVAENVTVVVPAGTFTGCLKTEERNALEPDALEFKYYAPGVGLVLEEDAENGERLELIQILP